MSRMERPKYARNKFLREKRDRKAAEAEVRKELATKRTPQEQLAILDAGGFTATKERVKLLAKIAAAAVKAEEALKAAEQPEEKKGGKAKRQAKKGKKAA